MRLTNAICLVVITLSVIAPTIVVYAGCPQTQAAQSACNGNAQTNCPQTTNFLVCTAGSTVFQPGGLFDTKTNAPNMTQAVIAFGDYAQCEVTCVCALTAIGGMIVCAADPTNCEATQSLQFTTISC
jgi:hypothetical protein